MVNQSLFQDTLFGTKD